MGLGRLSGALFGKVGRLRVGLEGGVSSGAVVLKGVTSLSAHSEMASFNLALYLLVIHLDAIFHAVSQSFWSAWRISGTYS